MVYGHRQTQKKTPDSQKSSLIKLLILKRGPFVSSFQMLFSFLDAPINKTQKTDEPASSAAGPLRTRGGFLLFPGPGASAPGFLCLFSPFFCGEYGTPAPLSPFVCTNHVLPVLNNTRSPFFLSLSPCEVRRCPSV